MRTTKKEVQYLFEQLCKTLCKPLAHPSEAITGAWYLENNPHYGGYRIVQFSNDLGGECHPMGERRRPAGQMADVIRFALTAIELERQNQ